MSTEPTTIRWEQDDTGVVTLVLDDPDQSANTMNQAFRDSLAAVTDRLEAEKDSIRGVIVTSAKKTFFAGGDLRDLIRVTPETAQDLFDGGMAIKRNLRRIETLGKPVVAAPYRPTVDYFVGQVKRFIGDWGYEGLKIDGQHLNAVTPCYNPAHGHARPEESTEGLARFWKAVYEAAHEANRDAVVELCPCGTAFAFHNLPYVDQYPSSDPLSSYQVRTKGKTMKALMGRGSSYSGDHVELSDGGDDFASSYGVGAVLSTKFTYPAGPDEGIVLTPERETLWRRWVNLYEENMLSTGEYRGELYDIGFDKPEAHVVAKGATLHYAFYAGRWDGTVELRGLGRGRYRLTDPFNGTSLGTVDARHNTVELAFERFQLIVAEHIG